MTNEKEYALVIDSEGRPLAPTKAQKAWFLIRKKRAKLVQRFPLTIQLAKKVEVEEDLASIECGIDDGSKHVGIALVQKCPTKNKVFFKGTIELRQDVKKKLETRAGYRKYRRYWKKYRKQRFDNRNSAIKQGIPAPSIKQKKESILRVIKNLRKYVKIDSIHLEDVRVDIRQLVEEKPLKNEEYSISNKLAKTIRRGALIRDNYTCQECGKSNCALEVHHIVPKRLNGRDSIYNVITLCKSCHQKTEGSEEKFIDKYQKIIDKTNQTSLGYAQHVMQGKTYLRNELSKIADLHLTNGIETSDFREQYNIEKSHNNDAICITGLKPDDINIKEYEIVPQRRKLKTKSEGAYGLKHRDLVIYTHTNNQKYLGIVSAIYADGTNSLNIKTKEKHFKRINYKRCRLFYRFNKIGYILPNLYNFL